MKNPRSEEWEWLDEYQRPINTDPGPTIVMLPPCRIGDEVWAVQKFHGKKWRAAPGTVSQMMYTDDMRLLIVVRNVCRGFWGDQIFRTQEEAEAEVAKRK